MNSTFILQLRSRYPGAEEAIQENEKQKIRQKKEADQMNEKQKTNQKEGSESNVIGKQKIRREKKRNKRVSSGDPSKERSGLQNWKAELIERKKRLKRKHRVSSYRIKQLKR